MAEVLKLENMFDVCQIESHRRFWACSTNTRVHA